MADTVQHFLEQMIPELEELQTSGVFSATEVKAIVQRRRELEYSVKRQGKERVDFLRYLQFEQRLERLRRLRMTRLGLRSLGRHADSGGVKRMHVLFRRALTRYAGDVRLWLQYIDFAIHVDSTRVLGRIFGEALALHPHEPSLWLLAAAWEYAHNANARAARVLLQRALRLNPRVPELYLEYARFELLYAQKLRERLELRPTHRTIAAEPAQEGVDLGSLPDAAAEAEGEGFLRLSTEDAAADSSDATQSARIVCAIFDAAVRALPEDRTLPLKFVVVCRAFAHTESAVAHVYAYLRTLAAHDAHLAALVCRHELDALRAAAHDETDVAFDEPYVLALRAACAAFEALLESAPPVQLEREYLLFLLDQLPLFTREHHVNEIVAGELRSSLRARCVLHDNDDVGDALLKTRALLTLGDVRAALALVRAASEHSRLQRSAAVWLTYAQLAARTPAPRNAAREQHALYLRALQACRPDAAEYIRMAHATWEHALRTALPFETHVRSLLEPALLVGDGVQQSALRCQFVQSLAQHAVAPEHVRAVVAQLCSVPPVSSAVVLACVRVLEARVLAAEADASEAEAQLRALLETSLRDVGAGETALWLAAVRLYLRRGELRRVHELHERAVRVLPRPQEFLLEYQALTNA